MTDTPPFNRHAADTVDRWVSKSNRLDAIAEATALPRVFSDGVRPEAAPQGSATSWALWAARQHKLAGDETLALVALAQHAAAALFSGDGYTHTTPEDVAKLLHWPVHLVKRVLEPRGHVWPLVEDRCDGEQVLGWRIPNEALDGNWLDRAARRAHYGAANQH